MCGGAGKPILSGVDSENTSIHIDLDLELSGGCLSGRARNGSGPEREFSGWLGMVGAIDALLPATFAPSDKAFPTPPQESPMTTIEHPITDVAALRGRMTGQAIAPGEPGWDETRLAYNLLLDQRPELIVVPVDEADVIEVVRYATEHGLRVAPQRTGHNAEPLGDLEGTVLLKTDAMNSVEIDAEARIARVGSGAKWQDVIPEASELGLAGVHGSTGDVSLAGYSLGGGLSWYGRKHGLQANNLTAIELVTADGELRRVNHDNEPELFWALRGGGGNYGVVTALEFKLFPLSEVYAGVMFFPADQAR